MLGIVYILKNFTDSDVPWGDGFTTAGSIVATWMLARKILEHWLVWVFVDSVAAGLYFYKGLYPSFLLYLIFTIIAVIGYFHWKRSLSENST
jgi:nicotinamide mononucleotide transporter